MKLHRGCAAVCLVLLSALHPSPTLADNFKAPLKWIGLCVKIDPASKLVSEAMLEVSSGDPKLDEDMRINSIGIPGPIHAPFDQWLELRTVGPEAASEGAEPDDLPLPNMSCARFNSLPEPR